MKTKKFQFNREFSWFVFIVPACIVYFIVTVIPTIKTFIYSFTNFSGLSDDYSFIGLHNYIKLLHNSDTLQSLANSLIYGFTVPVLVTLLAIPLALALNSNIKSKNVLRAVFFFPSVISTLFIGYIWKFILSSSSMGLINGIRTANGKETLALLSDTKMAMVLMILVAVWASVGWHSCIYIANLQTISGEYYEAAYLDGATRWQRFRYITLPMLAPAMTSSVMLLLTGSLKAYDLPFALTGGGPGHATTMITQTIIDEGVTSNQVGYASSMSFMFLIIICILTMIQTTFMSNREKKLYE